jgi:hypothetical protein
MEQRNNDTWRGLWSYRSVCLRHNIRAACVDIDKGSSQNRTPDSRSVARKNSLAPNVLDITASIFIKF